MSSADNPHDAIVYLQRVQEYTKDDTKTFNEFLEILKLFQQEEDTVVDFKSIAIKVTRVLWDYPELCVGFNSFLPDSDECKTEIAYDCLSKKYFVQDASGIEEITKVDRINFVPESTEPPTEEDALQLLSDLRNLLEGKASVYKKFMDVFKKRIQNPKNYPAHKVIKQIRNILRSYPEVYDRFELFLLRGGWTDNV